MIEQAQKPKKIQNSQIQLVQRKQVSVWHRLCSVSPLRLKLAVKLQNHPKLLDIFKVEIEAHHFRNLLHIQKLTL